MDKIRIYTVAQELGVPSQELLAYFEDNGLAFSSHLAMVDIGIANRARSHFAVPVQEHVETVLAPATANGHSSEKVVLDFAPFQVEAPEKTEKDDLKVDDDIFVASQEAVAKVERKVAAAAEAPVRQSLVSSALATASVAVVPTFAAFSILVFGQPHPRPFLAVLLSVLLTAGSIVIGSAIWATQPESAGFSFGDLMLWSWVRREAAERSLIENTAILGFDRFGRFLGKSTASSEEQMRAVREIAAALDSKSSYTLGHSKRVEKHARKVAEAMGLSDDEITNLATAAALHDIGNIQIPDAVLRKAGELTIEERSAIEAHVLLGARMVLKAGNDDVVDGIRHHHERWDGAGYPDGMSGEEIPLFARIIGIAEAYDAMTSTRPYRQGLGREQAIQVLRAEAGFQFDGDLVEMFVSTLPKTLAIIEKFPVLGRVQRQMLELQLLFKRMGAVAVSATASTIAIALILGGTVLSPGTSDAPELAERNRSNVTPIDRVLASRLTNDAAAAGLSAPVDALSPRGTTSAADLSAYAQELSRVASIDGDETNISGGLGQGPGSAGPGSGGNNPGGSDGSVGTGPVREQPGPGRGTDGGTVGGGTSGRDGAAGSTDGGSTVTPPPASTSPGKSANAPGRNKGGTRGNSANAPGRNKDGTRGNSANAPGHSGTAPGNSANAPGHSGSAPGNSGNAGGGSSNAGGNSSNAGGGSSNAGGNSSNAGGGSSNAGGNSSNAGGNSSNAGGNSSNAGGGSSNAGGSSSGGGSSNSGGGSSAGVGAGAGAVAAPGNSASAPGRSANSAPAPPSSSDAGGTGRGR